MHCESCSSSVENTLQKLDGFQSASIDLGSQLVSVTSSIPPSQVVKSMRDIGKDAIVRGAGGENGMEAAVAILESHHPKDIQKGASASPVMGLVRIVGVAPQKTLFDLLLSAPSLGVGTYYANIRSSGNISKGALLTGSVYKSLGPIEVTQEQGSDNFSGQSFVTKDISISELIGRSVTVSKLETEVDDLSLVGVIARSAGIWQNDKTVCSCSGKTIWQERQDAIERGIR